MCCIQCFMALITLNKVQVFGYLGIFVLVCSYPFFILVYKQLCVYLFYFQMIFVTSILQEFYNEGLLHVVQNTNCSRPDVVLFSFQKQYNVIKSICRIKYILALVLGDQLSNGKDTDNSKFLFYQNRQILEQIDNGTDGLSNKFGQI